MRCCCTLAWGTHQWSCHLSCAARSPLVTKPTFLLATAPHRDGSTRACHGRRVGQWMTAPTEFQSGPSCLSRKQHVDGGGGCFVGPPGDLGECRRLRKSRFQYLSALSVIFQKTSALTHAPFPSREGRHTPTRRDESLNDRYTSKNRHITHFLHRLRDIGRITR